MQRIKFIRLALASASVLLIAGAALFYGIGSRKQGHASKVGAFFIQGIGSNAENASIGEEPGSGGYFSIFNFITNLAPRN